MIEAPRANSYDNLKLDAEYVCVPQKEQFMKNLIAVTIFLLSGTFAFSFAQQVEPVPIKQLGTYKKGGMTWTNLLIPRKLKPENLIKVAQELHRAEPSVSFRFFDDDSQFQQFKDWDLNYPNAAYPYPEKWVKTHHVANLQKMAYDSSGPKWVLIKGYTSEKIADILPDSLQPANSSLPAKNAFNHNEEIVIEYDRYKDLTTVRLKPMIIFNSSTGQLSLGALFVYSGKTPTRPSFVTLQIISISSQWQYRTNRELILLLDGQRTPYGEMNSDISRVVDDKAAESISINLQYEDFRRISDAKKVKGKVGQKEFVLQAKQVEALRDFASRIYQ